MKGFGQFVEAKSKTAVFTFGRFNPPTIGHQKLLQAVLRTAKREGVNLSYLAVSLRIVKRILCPTRQR